MISGITACTTMVIPSLFPFMALVNFFDFSGGTHLLNKVFEYPAKLLMGRYYNFFSVYLMSLVGGYPVGANMLNSLVKNGTTDKNTAQTVLLFSVNSSPAFVIFAVGEGMLFSKKIGLVIFLANLLSSVITLILVTRISKIAPLYKKDAVKCSPLNNAFVEGITKASISMAFMCGFVLIFFALNEIFSFFPFGKLTAVISTVGEVTSSVSMLSTGGKLSLISAVTSFGGVCVLLQIMAVSKEFSPKLWPLLLIQLLKGVLSYFITCVILKIFPEIGLWRYEEVISNMTSPGRFGISSTPITSACLILTAGVMLYNTIRIISNKENKTNEEFGIYK